MFIPSLTSRVNTLYCLEEWKEKQIISLPGDNFTPALGDKIHNWGENFAPGGQSLPLESKLRIGLRQRDIKWGEFFIT
jgi:hypothetical protein